MTKSITAEKPSIDVQDPAPERNTTDIVSHNGAAPVEDQTVVDEPGAPEHWGSLSAESRDVIDSVIKRAVRRENDSLPVTWVGLMQDGLKLDDESGKEFLKNLVTADRPPFLSADEHAVSISLPDGTPDDKNGFAKLMASRRSVRDYTSHPVTLEEVAAILKTTCGLHSTFRTTKKDTIPYSPFTPSGGGLMSVVPYYVSLNTEGLQRGIYRYRHETQSLETISLGEVRGHIFQLCAFQDWIPRAGGLFVLASDLDRLQWKYGNRSYRLTHLDAGVMGQSIHLAAASIGLGSSMLFGFFDDDMNQFMGLDGDRSFVSLLVSVGRPVPNYFSMLKDEELEADDF